VLAPIRIYAVELVTKDTSSPVVLTFDAEEAQNVAEALNHVRLQGRLDDDGEAEPEPVAVVRHALMIYQPTPRLHKEVLA
jgi:hypothetical protein